MCGGDVMAAVASGIPSFVNEEQDTNGSLLYPERFGESL